MPSALFFLNITLAILDLLWSHINVRVFCCRDFCCRSESKRVKEKITGIGENKFRWVSRPSQSKENFVLSQLINGYILNFLKLR